MKTGITERAARFITGLEIENIPADVVGAAKHAALDYFSVGMAGTAEPVFFKIKALIDAMPTPGKSTVFTARYGYSPEKAALLNGVAAHALDFDDVHEAIHGHPSAVLWPAVVAAAEACGAGGKEALAAYIGGAEIMCSLGSAIDKTHYGRGWHATATVGCIGAAAAAARIMKLTAGETVDAMGLAGSFAGGLRCNFGSMAKPVHAGWAAHNGIMAALMAKRGIEAADGVLEAESGFIRCFSDEPVLSAEKSFDELGTVYGLPKLKFKAFPCCTATHAAICASKELHKAVPGLADPSCVERVVCYCKPWQPTVLKYPVPASGMEARFSMQFCVARALVYGELKPEDFSDSGLSDKTVSSLMKKIEMIPKELDEYAVLPTVEVYFKNKAVYKQKCEFAKGNPNNPLTEEEHQHKFMLCTEPLIGREEALKAAELIMQMEGINRIDYLTRFFISVL